MTNVREMVRSSTREDLRLKRLMNYKGLKGTVRHSSLFNLEVLGEEHTIIVYSTNLFCIWNPFYPLNRLLFKYEHTFSQTVTQIALHLLVHVLPQPVLHPRHPVTRGEFTSEGRPTTNRTMTPSSSPFSSYPSLL